MLDFSIVQVMGTPNPMLFKGQLVYLNEAEKKKLLWLLGGKGMGMRA